jgi:hypothetical protein
MISMAYRLSWCRVSCYPSSVGNAMLTVAGTAPNGPAPGSRRHHIAPLVVPGVLTGRRQTSTSMTPLFAGFQRSAWPLNLHHSNRAAEVFGNFCEQRIATVAVVSQLGLAQPPRYVGLPACLDLQ